MGNLTGIKKYNDTKSETAKRKVEKAIRELQLKNNNVNFNSISKLSGVSKTFLYKNKELKNKIESLRNKQISKEINQRAKFDKTSKSKDVIIVAKDKKIAKLEEENKKLKEELNTLRGLLYKNY